MAYLSLEDFERDISSSVLESDIAKIPDILVQTLTSIKLRVPLESGDFIDCFFNEITKRTSFALIRRDKRIFGANNTGGWHIHPFGDPTSHKTISGAILFKDFLKKIEAYQKKTKRKR